MSTPSPGVVSDQSVKKVSPLFRLTRRLTGFPLPRPLRQWLRRRWLARVEEECIVDVLGFKMHLRPADLVDGSLLMVPQLYEATEIAFLKSHLKPGDTFLDIGSHIGFFSLRMSEAVGAEGTIIAMEASPETFGRLQQNVEMNALSQVRCLNVGVSDKQETLRLGFRDAANTGANSFMLQDAEQGVEVPCRPLLEILRSEGVTSVAAAKFDIEGFEYRVLKEFFIGAEKALYPKAMVIELNPLFFPRESEQALELLQSHGYRSLKTTSLNHLMVLDS